MIATVVQRLSKVKLIKTYLRSSTNFIDFHSNHNGGRNIFGLPVVLLLVSEILFLDIVIDEGLKWKKHTPVY